MQKKLMAVAVAGALGAPALALAQASTVSIYGSMYMEYSFIDQGRQSLAVPAGGATNNRNNIDMLQTPGSNIGFKGEEQLGGGMSAWFQCETTADVRGETDGVSGLCSRNSALGLKGSFGNFYAGTWDTPFKRAAGIGAVGSRDTGVFGGAFLLFGNSTTTSENSTAAGFAGQINRITFKRRQRNVINYDSPSFSGFQVMAAVSTTTGSTAVTSGLSNSKPRVWSLAATYANGPLAIGAGYERHKDFGANVLAGTSQSDNGWLIDASYTFAGTVKLGALYTRQKFEIAPGLDNRVNSWTVGVDWKIAGPHSLLASYVHASDTHGPCAAGLAPGVVCVASPGTGRMAVFSDGNSGAKLWQIRYGYAMSKRTRFEAGYSKLDNDTNANYGLGGPARPAAGEGQHAFAVSLEHKF